MAYSKAKIKAMAIKHTIFRQFLKELITQMFTDFTVGFIA
jgi:hypothetical protein